MKKFIGGVIHHSGQVFAHESINARRLLSSLTLLFFALVLFSSCQKESVADDPAALADPQGLAAQPEALNRYTGISPATLWELQQAKAASAKYKHIENAIRDGYMDISVDVEHMGHHYMNPGLLDGEFDYSKPELLVYNKDHDGRQQLVAVEYAIPLSAPRPAGFTGTADVWDGNAGFSLWLLHAWVWEYNPMGVFNPTNPLVHLH